MFEGRDMEARTYFKWHIVVDRGYSYEERFSKPLFAKVMRFGKTAREHANGKHDRRLTNMETRSAFYRERGAKRPEFPMETCNGRETRAIRAAWKRKPKQKGKHG